MTDDRARITAIVKLALVGGLSAALVALVWGHVPGINGPFYWKWHWRRLEALPVIASMAAASVPFWLGQWVQARWRRVGVALALVAAGTFLLQLAAVSVQPPGGLSRAVALVRNDQATSYFTDAEVIAHNRLRLRDWLADYPKVLPMMHIHSRYKPPGAVLFHLGFVKALGGGDRAAMADALAMAVLAALAGPACYGMMRAYGCAAGAAFAGASLLALSPALVLIYPQLDQVYATVSCILLAAWGLALARRSVLWAIVFAAILAAAAFTSYIFLALGVFLAVYTILYVGESGRAGVKTAAVLGLVVIAIITAFYAILWLVARFDPVRSFQVIDALQMKGIVWLGRPWPQHLPFDLLDFLLGAGWITGLLAAFWMARSWRAQEQRETGRKTGWLALLQIVILCAVGMLPGETARLWLPFLPLLMVPAGIELATWTQRHRNIVYACLLAITISLCRNMIFVYAGPDTDGMRPFHLPFKSPAERAAMEQIDPDPR